jgi:hypothetical protein
VPGRVEHAEHHRDAALTRERGEVRGRAAELRYHAGDARQDVAECWPRDTRHQDVARRDTGELALAVDDDRAPRTPADACGMTVQARVRQPDVVRHVRRLHMQRPCLQELEARVVERPFDLDRMA